MKRSEEAVPAVDGSDILAGEDLSDKTRQFLARMNMLQELNNQPLPTIEQTGIIKANEQ
jgi:hypothetical protein